MHQPVRNNSRSQTGTPGAIRTQSVGGGHRTSGLYTVRRVLLVVPLTANPTVPSWGQLNSAEMGVLGTQEMFTYIQAHLALPQHQPGVVGGSGGSFPANDAVSTIYARAVPVGTPHQMQLRLTVTDHGGIHAHPSDVNMVSGVNTTKSTGPLFHRRTPAACTFVCVSILLCVQTDALASAMLS